jgi:zinc transporter
MDSLAESRNAADVIDIGTKPKSLGIVPGLVWAFRIHDDGSAEPLPVDQPIQDYRDGWVWVHLNLTDVRTSSWLDTTGLPATALSVLRARTVHQQLHVSGDCVHGVISDLIRDIERPTEKMAHLRFVMTEHLLVSGRHHALSAIGQARQEIECGSRRLANVATLLELIIERVADAIDGLADELSAKLDAVEDRLLKKGGDERHVLARVRRTSGRVHRQLSGLRTLFHRLDREGLDRLKPALRLAAGRMAQRLDALDHDIIEMRDRARLLQEEVSARLTEETNKHLHVLSVLTMLFLPPTLITGIFGMNTKGLPLTDNEYGFMLAICLLIMSSLGVYLFMKRRGMLDAGRPGERS